MKGKIIDIEGLDGSGKETQARLICEWFNKNGHSRAKYIEFPDYKSESSSLVKMYLNGEFGTNPMDVNPYAASSFFAVDRFSSFKKNWKKDYIQGSWIIANRYVVSNALYQMPKLDSSEWENYLTWVYDYEYNRLGLPKPAVTIYLDVPVNVSQNLMDKRYRGDLSKMDLHESHSEFLDLCYSAGKYVAKRDDWVVIDCMSPTGLKSVGEISNEIINLIENQYFIS